MALEDKVRSTLLDRARKRQIAFQQGSGGWLVLGDPRLGDAYPSYRVDEDGNGYHRCSCQAHVGGQYRRTCSHILAVILWKRETGYRPGSTREVAPGAAETPAAGDGMGVDPISSPAAGSASPTGRLVSAMPSSPSWGTPPLPDWVASLREHQVDAIEEVVEAFDRGAKVVFLDAPTGSGKTLIGECVRRLVNGDSRSIYTCSTLTLQDQFLHDFPYARVIKGRRNYPTEHGPEEVTCDDCTKEGPEDPCRWCDTCPYIVARGRAASADLAVLNTAYAMTVWNKGPGRFRDYELVIIDECDLLESALMSYAEVRVSEGQVIRYGLDYPKHKTVRETWLAWAVRTQPLLVTARRQVHGDSLSAIRERKRLTRLLADIGALEAGLRDEDARWVYAPEGKTIVFKPVTVNQLGADVLWQHGKRFLVMSASIISASQMAADLGLEEDWDLVTVPSTFPVDNRPIYVCNVGSMARKQQAETLPRMLEAVEKVVAHHPGERVLVHAVSYKLAKEIADYLSRRLDNRSVVTYTEGRGREAALRRYLESDGAVMVAPSMDRGVDLPGDKCRVQVIAKVPFPNLGDKQVEQRLYATRGGETWFAVQTVRTLVQMTGRGVRSASDRAATYILDGNFVRLFNKWEFLFPAWWKEAVVWDGRKRMELGL